MQKIKNKNKNTKNTKKKPIKHRKPGLLNSFSLSVYVLPLFLFPCRQSVNCRK